jgi:hypothetical protein
MAKLATAPCVRPGTAGRSLREPPFSAVVLLGMEHGIMRRKFGNRHDWWDWCVILLIVVGGTIILWTSVWIAHSRANGAGMHAQTAISRAGS